MASLFMVISQSTIPGVFKFWVYCIWTLLLKLLLSASAAVVSIDSVRIKHLVVEIKKIVSSKEMMAWDRMNYAKA